MYDWVSLGAVVSPLGRSAEVLADRLRAARRAHLAEVIAEWSPGHRGEIAGVIATIQQVMVADARDSLPQRIARRVGGLDPERRTPHDHPCDFRRTRRMACRTTSR